MQPGQKMNIIVGNRSENIFPFIRLAILTFISMNLQAFAKMFENEKCSKLYNIPFPRFRDN